MSQSCPKATIKRYAEKKNGIGTEVKYWISDPHFLYTGENSKPTRIKLYECFFGLTIPEIRKLAFDIHHKHSLSDPFIINKMVIINKY